MARSFSFPATTFRPYEDGSPRTHGPFRIDSMTRNDTTHLEAVFTVEGWPDTTDTLFVIVVRWSNGDGANIAVSGRQINKDGTPRDRVVTRIGVPRTPNGKKAISGGSIALDVHREFRTSVSFRAV